MKQTYVVHNCNGVNGLRGTIHEPNIGYEFQVDIKFRFKNSYYHMKRQKQIAHSSWFELNFYRPQRSWVKVMFLQVSVILSTGEEGVCLSACWDASPPRADTPRSRHHPLDQAPLRSRHPSGADTHTPPPPRPGTPLGADTPRADTPHRPGTPAPPQEQTPRKQTPAYGQ